jgi:hypothetical protein
VYTDHRNIAHFAKTQELSGRQLRYAEYLAELDYVTIHREGSENGRADTICRRLDLYTGKIKTKEKLLHPTPKDTCDNEQSLASDGNHHHRTRTTEGQKRIIQQITSNEIRRLITRRANWIGSC